MTATRTEARGAELDADSADTLSQAATGTPRPESRDGLKSRLDDAPLRTKLTLLVTIAAGSGALTGVLEARVGDQVWPVLLTLGVIVFVVTSLGHWWIAGPIDRLTHRLERLAKAQRAVQLRDLPVQRRDEIGRIARAMHQVSASAIRCQFDARQLRRTMDHRVEQQTRQATRRLEKLALQDSLTGLGNRRFLDEQLGPLASASSESGAELVGVLLDMDNFKAVNDTLGHAAGDELLKLLSELITQSVREGDLAIRLGGDEFAVFMPGATAERAAEMIDNLRRHFRQRSRAMHRDGPHADISAGVATLLGDGCDSEQALIDRADQRLYDAKESGKGKTVRDG